MYRAKRTFSSEVFCTCRSSWSQCESGWWHRLCCHLEGSPFFASFWLSPDELGSVWLDFSAWFSFPFCRGTVCGFYILPLHHRFVTDWCGEPASPKARLSEPQAAVVVLAQVCSSLHPGFINFQTSLKIIVFP